MGSIQWDFLRTTIGNYLVKAKEFGRTTAAQRLPAGTGVKEKNAGSPSGQHQQCAPEGAPTNTSVISQPLRLKTLASLSADAPGDIRGTQQTPR